MSTALVLAGAVAKGAFEAGVLSVLAERGERISMLVATSAGSLNAAVYATGVRCGREKRAAEVLQRLWMEQGDWQHIVDFSFLDALAGRGLSSIAALQNIVERGMQNVAESSESNFRGEPALGDDGAAGTDARSREHRDHDLRARDQAARRCLRYRAESACGGRGCGRLCRIPRAFSCRWSCRAWARASTEAP
ncbi:MAG: patatin-like phospholipase family protein [Pseudomonadota bacterium]